MSRVFGSILVICTRRIGDVLLATPVVRSLKRANPGTAVDMLVFDGTQDIVAANPDLRAVLAISERPSLAEHFRLIASIFRRYDLAVSVLAGDRPTLYAWVAGRNRMGTLADDAKSRWKRRLLNAWVPFDNLETHTVTMNLKVVGQLGIAPQATPIVSWNSQDEAEARAAFPQLDSAGSYAVLHVSPKFPYKMWTERGWLELMRWLSARRLRVLLAGGPASAERQLVSALLGRAPEGTLGLAGHIGLPALGFILSRAAVYVGTDTAVSHMAAALGAPTIALYGPSNPVKWGPWPKNFAAEKLSPWSMRGSGRVGNVYLLQGNTSCIPCLQEGCERHVNSLSDCLQHLPASRVIAAVDAMLATGSAATCPP